MDHKLRVLVRLDIDSTSAVVNVTGCLTGNNCKALFPVIRRAGAFAGGLAVAVDLSEAEHIDGPGLERLRQFCTGELNGEPAPEEVAVIAPAGLPQCPALMIGDPAMGVAA
ncbi:hypothetical protein [Arthrobacter sp. H14]|uniref:hypothetical protein n=1 Tax=Arthrobacter sp. H14 TaxID=1312959 RepID=UPI0012DD4819|nr:hypothetical protein [Arthrobacter sp. H14]